MGGVHIAINQNRTDTMNMNKIPTPETDAVEKEFTVDSKQNPQHRLALKSRNLERRLTVARETLKKLDNWLMRDAQRKQIIEQALTQTAPKPCTKTQ